MFSNTLCRTSCKMLKKRCFSHFLRTLYKVPRKTWKKYCHLIFFCGTSCKKLKKNMFFRIFCELCRKCLEKREKTLFSDTFRGTSCKKVKKPCYVVFLWNLYKVPWKTCKNTFFSHFLWVVVQKSQKTLFFRIFCEHCTKCIEKREKTLFSHNFYVTSCKKLKKHVFRIFCEICTKCLEKREKKHCFLTLFVESRAYAQKT